METRLIPTDRNAWTIEGDNGCLGELRKIKGLFVIVPASGSLLDDIKGGYDSQAAAMDAIAKRTGGVCKVRGR